MRKILTAALLLTACRRPLEPGETRCVPVGGILKCRSAPAERPAPAPDGWYCVARDDGFGPCFRRPVDCERMRDDNDGFSECAWKAVAHCIGERCFNSRKSCLDYAYRNDADGDCEAEQ